MNRAELTEATRRNFEAVRQNKIDFTNAQLEFILAEIELGATLAQLALNATELDKRQRNIRNARRAYDSGSERLKNAKFSPSVVKGLLIKLGALQKTLEQIGERF